MQQLQQLTSLRGSDSKPIIICTTDYKQNSLCQSIFDLWNCNRPSRLSPKQTRLSARANKLLIAAIALA